MEMSFSVFEKIDPSCQNGNMEKAKNIPYHQRPYASIAERTLVDISIYSPRPQIAGTGHSHSKISIHSPRMGRDVDPMTEATVYAENGLPVKLRNKPSQGENLYWLVRSETPATIQQPGEEWSQITALCTDGIRRTGWMMSRFLVQG